jgi:metal-dependent HD superfamily phosphatase/phosphodiesterase
MEAKLITPIQVKENEEVKFLIATADRQLKEMGYTEHSLRHLTHVSKAAGKTLLELGFSSRESELAEIAGYLHDIGNAINRTDHAHSSAIMAYELLLRMGMPYSETCEIMLAIGNHDENSGTAVSIISAALILADKSDVHRSRVQNTDFSTFDIHDRVNYAVDSSILTVDNENKSATLQIHIDTKICPVMDYFEIFLTRMTMCRRAATYLKLNFELIINENRLL